MDDKTLELNKEGTGLSPQEAVEMAQMFVLLNNIRGNLFRLLMHYENPNMLTSGETAPLMKKSYDLLNGNTQGNYGVITVLNAVPQRDVVSQLYKYIQFDIVASLNVVSMQVTTVNKALFARAKMGRGFLPEECKAVVINIKHALNSLMEAMTIVYTVIMQALGTYLSGDASLGKVAQYFLSLNPADVNRIINEDQRFSVDMDKALDTMS